jgi:hypothetical protein
MEEYWGKQIKSWGENLLQFSYFPDFIFPFSTTNNGFAIFIRIAPFEGNSNGYHENEVACCIYSSSKMEEYWGKQIKSRGENLSALLSAPPSRPDSGMRMSHLLQPMPTAAPATSPYPGGSS